MRFLLACTALVFVGCGASQAPRSLARSTCAQAMCPFVGVWESSAHALLFIDGESLFAHTGWTQRIDPDVCILSQQHGIYRHRLALHGAELHASICSLERSFHVEGERLIESDGTAYSRVDESRAQTLMHAIATADVGEELGRFIDATR